MNKAYFSGVKPVRKFLRRVLTMSIIALLLNCGPSEAKVGQKVSFTWRANAPHEDVIGYRLYYGNKSRFNANGTPKLNFNYDYYLDFAEQKRCTSAGNSAFCEDLTNKDLNCVGLYRESPRCTIANLRGKLYFALTAYNNQAESRFSRELNLLVDAKALSSVQNSITNLLIKP